MKTNLVAKSGEKLRNVLNYFTSFKYPKLLLLVLTMILAYNLFKNPLINSKIASLGELSYLGIFIAGMFFTFGFSAPFAVGFFIVSNPGNIFLASVIGGFGALIADLLIFRTIKFSFSEEINSLKKLKIISFTNNLIKKSFGRKIANYLLYLLAGIAIASPLPDEVGVAMLAGLTEINEKVFAVASFILNSAGIFVILLLS